MDEQKPTLMDSVKKIYSLESNKNRKFTIEITNKHNSIYIYAFYEDDLKNDEYEKEYKLEDLRKDKFLSIFESIDNIFEELINFFNIKISQIKLIEEQNKLIISIPLESDFLKHIILEINIKNKTIQEKYDELYNMIIKLKNENDNLNQNLSKNEKEINELKKCPFPIGAIYTQYPNCKEPKELWSKTDWELLNYNGAFFRSIGGKSLDFGKLQKEGLPNITGNKLLAWTDYSGGGIIMNPNTNIKESAIYSYQDSKYDSLYSPSSCSSKKPQHHNILGFNANRANSIYGNSENVTPENYAIKIWKRIS